MLEKVVNTYTLWNLWQFSSNNLSMNPILCISRHICGTSHALFSLNATELKHTWHACTFREGEFCTYPALWNRIQIFMAIWSWEDALLWHVFFFFSIALTIVGPMLMTQRTSLNQKMITTLCWVAAQLPWHQIPPPQLLWRLVLMLREEWTA